MLALAGLAPVVAGAWSGLGFAERSVVAAGLLVTIIFGILAFTEVFSGKRAASAERDLAVRAATVLLASLGAKRIKDRLEPNEVHYFTGEAREQAEVLLSMIRRNPALLARLDPEPEPEGVLSARDEQLS